VYFFTKSAEEQVYELQLSISTTLFVFGSSSECYEDTKVQKNPWAATQHGTKQTEPNTTKADMHQYSERYYDKTNTREKQSLAHCVA